MWSLDDDGLRATAPARTDLFTDPATGVRDSSAPRLLADVPHLEHYRLSAKVTVDFAATYDAGVLALWATPDRFAKFCFEYSPQGRPMAVSVVTRGVSDDANGFTVDDRALWMRIAKTGPTYAFHASTDGTTWQFVRHFELAGDPKPQVGFLAQSPTRRRLLGPLQRHPLRRSSTDRPARRQLTFCPVPVWMNAAFIHIEQMNAAFIQETSGAR